MTTNINQFFNENSGIRVEYLKQWLNWAGGIDKSVFIALPMIQRGSVWKPTQIIDLWDSLLRGMPLGSLMVSCMPKGEKVRPIGKKELETIPDNGGLGLIDGQQRTLSMLIAWPGLKDQMDKKVWIDFADKPYGSHLFRLHVTTKNQPFGFQKASPSTKLSLNERRKAQLAYLKAHNLNDDNCKNGDFFLNAEPWESIWPIELNKLIKFWLDYELDTENLDWEDLILKELKGLKFNKSNGYDEKEKQPKFRTIVWDDLEPEIIKKINENISKFKKSLEYMFKMQIPIIEVRSEFFNETDGTENVDPTLAVLFKRIGTGGTALSDADYVYSVIKHFLPEAYTLVEELHGEHNIAGLLSATDLVMTAVRIAATEFIPTDNKQLPDLESPSKQDFHRMIKHENFLKSGFLPLIQENGLKETFKLFTTLIKYRNKQSNTTSIDIGLPEHAFPTIQRPLVQVILKWIRLVQKHKNANEAKDILEVSRYNVIRFILYWQLCVTDSKKASKLAFEKLNSFSEKFPDKVIYKFLVENNVAFSIFSPEELKKLSVLGYGNFIYTTDWKNEKLRGWTRFYLKPNVRDDVANARDLYSRWWNKSGSYVHPLLLWLQRETVNTFQGSPVAGRDEETPYDYDHICPSNHWYDWTGVGGTNKIIDFFSDAKKDNQGHWRVGNSIGNLRVWDSIDNRSLGDSAPRDKLNLDVDDKNRSTLLRQSAINESQIEFWSEASGKKGEGKKWDENRTEAFQRAVELRAFTLYESYFNDLHFSDWGSEA